MDHAEHLRKHFSEALRLPESATMWLLDLWRVVQFFDDVADQDHIGRQDFDDALWSAMIAMPSNPFFSTNQSVLLPVMATQILKWQASDRSERAGRIWKKVTCGGQDITMSY